MIPEGMTPEEADELEELQEDFQEDLQDDRHLSDNEWQEDYGFPQEEEKHNAHTFLHRAVEAQDPLRTTFLTTEELGRPIFTARFLLDIEDMAIHYINPLCKALGMNPQTHNKLAIYFNEKTKNMTASGMSNKGFAMNLNVTRRMDATRKRLKGGSESQENQKGGKNK